MSRILSLTLFSFFLSSTLNTLSYGAPILAVGQGPVPKDVTYGKEAVKLFTYDAGTYTAAGVLKPYAASFKGGINVAIADTNGDSTQELIISGAGPTRPLVQIHSFGQGVISKTPTSTFSPFDGTFKGGANIAAGYFTPDAQQDLVFGSTQGAGRVKVYNVATQSTLLDFFPFGESFKGGVFVATGDFNGDFYSDIVVGAGKGGEPRVMVFNGKDGSQLQTSIGSFLAFESNFKGGVRVATGDVNGDGKLDIITGGGPGAGPRIVAYSGVDATKLLDFFAYDEKFKGGVYVSAGDVTGDGKADVIVGPGKSTKALPVILFDSSNSSEATSITPFGKKWLFGGIVHQF